MKRAMFTIKRRTKPMLAAVVAYSETTGRLGRVIVSEPIRDEFTNEDLVEVARRLVPQAEGYVVALPVGVEIKDSGSQSKTKE